MIAMSPRKLLKFEDLESRIKAAGLPVDLDNIHLAYDYAVQAHGNQRRKSGEPYINHPIHTALRLIDLGMDEDTIIAGLLHDVPEDTDKTLKDLGKEFGDEVEQLVAGVTKLGQVKYRGMEKYVENLRRMFVAMAKDIRVIVIRFCDRIHNLETLGSLPPEKQYRIALESLEIYAPIANRLGMGEIKGIIEDLSFPYIYPEEWQWLKNKVKAPFQEREKYIERFKKDLIKILNKNDLTFISLHGRSKHFYSLYRKLLHHNRDITKIYDLVALRLVVKDISDCYRALGIVHRYCKPLKGRIKDYISQPKPNGYQSLHTTVFTPHGKIVEIQIRTEQMHEEAEFGIAVHWHYKESGSQKMNKEKLEWIEQLMKMQKEISSGKEYLDSLKIDIFQNHIFVFTPRGDVIDLPEDATPIDFAYRIHTELGHKCIGAKVNDLNVSLDTKLKSGDVVYIYIDKNRPGPSEDWLEFIKTNSARQSIRQWFNKQRKKGWQRLLDFS